MKQPPRKQVEKFPEIKKNIESAYKYFAENNRNFYKSKSFVFKSALSAVDIQILQDTQKPQIEVNICESFVSRLLGEFSTQEPSAVISLDKENPTDLDLQVLDTVEGYIRHQLKKLNASSIPYESYKNQLSGGFDVWRVYPDYKNATSMEIEIKIERVFDPTACGFDPLAREPHKGDGKFCFEYVPIRLDKFKEMYPDVDTDSLDMTMPINDGFKWFYRNDGVKIIVLCNYYEKILKKVKLIELANKMTLTEEQYKEYKSKFDMENRIEQPAAIVNSRYTLLPKIVRHKLIGSEILEYTETDFDYLPLVFFDSNSAMISDEAGSLKQFTRPYFYNAMGIQRLANFGFQTLANELENMVQHKFMGPLEGIPDNYKDAYVNIQKPSFLAYNQFLDNNTDVRLDPPQAIPRVGAPPELLSSFQIAQTFMQMSLGSYDSSLGINNNQLSGVAVVKSATLSNAAAMPCLVSYLASLTRVIEINVSLIPKYFNTPRSMPVITKEGKKTYVNINDEGKMQMDFKPTDLNVLVSSGPNFNIQQQEALDTIGKLSASFPAFGQFMNTEGLPTLFDNLNFRGSQQLKAVAEKWQANMKQQQAKNANTPPPEMQKLQLQAQKLQMETVRNQQENEIKKEENAIKILLAQNERTKILTDLHLASKEELIEKERMRTEDINKTADLMLQHKDLNRTHNRADMEMAHRLMDNERAKERKSEGVKE